MTSEQLEQLERIARLKEQGMLTEDEAQAQKAIILGKNPSTASINEIEQAPAQVEEEETSQTGFKLAWWHIILGLFVLGYTLDRFSAGSPKKAILFDNPQETMRTMENTGVGYFPRYNCVDGRCWAYIGSRPEPKKNHAVTSMHLIGSDTQIDTIQIQCIIWKEVKNKKGSRAHFFSISRKAIENLGGTQQFADSLSHLSLNGVSFGDYTAKSTVEDDTYEITIVRKL